MSDTESFESVAKSYDNCTWIGRDGVKRAIDRLKAAHDREIAQAQRSTDTKHKEVATRLYSLRFHGGRFGPELSHALGGCEANEDTDTITGSYSRVLDNLARLREAHDRDMRDARECMDKLWYHRGYCDGQHSMDAEHRAIAMRLRQLPRGCTGFSDAHVSWFADLAWAMGIKEPTFAVLRDELVRLMGGVSDGIAETMTTDEFIEYVEEDTRRLKGEATGAGDDSGTCACAGGGACDADCGCNSVEQEVNDGRTGDSCIRSHPLRSIGRNDVCVRRDSGEHSRGQEVSGGRVADDCGGDTAGSYRGLSVHMDGLTTYDVLDNERRKAIAKLKEVSNGYFYTSKMQKSEKTYFGPEIFLGHLVSAIDVSREGAKNDGMLHQRIADRLIHLLGGDQPSGIDVLRAMDDGHSWTCPESSDEVSESAPSVSITDELRECVSTASKSYDNTPWYDMGEGEEADHTTCHVTEGELMRIADRIDEQFDRICAQHEAVLQSTIDDIVGERGEGHDLFMPVDVFLRERDKLRHDVEIWRDRSEDMRMERDDACVKCDNLLDLLRDAREEYMNAQALCDELRYQREELMRKWMHGRAERNRLAKERDDLQAKLDEYDRTHVELPKDANGEVFRLGCTVRMVERHPEVLLTVHSMTLCDDGMWRLYAYDDEGKYSCNLSTESFEVCEPKPDTAESIVRDLSMGAVTESEAIKRIEALND